MLCSALKNRWRSNQCAESSRSRYHLKEVYGCEIQEERNYILSQTREDLCMCRVKKEWQGDSEEKDSRAL